jgi:ABC-type dipeptide/oligopeptide/nickel transport system ATPase component
LEIDGLQGTFSYLLSIEFAKEQDKVRIQSERLLFDKKPLFEMTVKGKECEVQLYRDNNSLGPNYPFSWNQSGMYTIQERSDNQKLSWFKKYISSIVCLKINPFASKVESSMESSTLSDNAANFVDWYRYASQEYQGELPALFSSLAEVFDGFKNLQLDKTGSTSKALKFVNKEKIVYDFYELSDGQRVLLMLHTLLCLRQEEPITLLLDEPDNYVALREIQPFLMRLSDMTEEKKAQVLIISHNSEVVNLLGPSHGYITYRTNNSPTRIKPITIDAADKQIALSELLARGWTQ